MGFSRVGLSWYVETGDEETEGGRCCMVVVTPTEKEKGRVEGDRCKMAIVHAKQGDEGN